MTNRERMEILRSVFEDGEETAIEYYGEDAVYGAFVEPKKRDEEENYD